MGSKNLKKSTMKQLRTLVLHMEENPDFANGAPRFEVNRRSAEEEWKDLCRKINELGPPMRTLSDWKKTWADLKSRTKKKLMENKKSLLKTGGLLYRYNHLTELEQIIERILYLPSVEPSGNLFVENAEKSESQFNQTLIDDCYESMVETPPRNISTKIEESEKLIHENDQQLPHSEQKHDAFKRAYSSNSDNEQIGCSYAKKPKRTLDEQLASLRRQLRIVERSAAMEKVDNAKRLADAAEAQAEAARRNADATVVIAASMKAMEESTKRIEKILENYLLNTKNKKN